MSANDHQVGGSHYKDQAKNELQHWDMAVDHEYDYFQGAITKYVDRWKHKHATKEKKLEDLRKGLHYYQKYIEAVEQGYFMPDDA